MEIKNGSLSRAGTIQELPKPKYRIFWTWDFASNWDSSYFGKIRGCSGKNFRRSAFLNDYKRMVDYAAAHHFNGIVIWGAVRAHDNGVEQLKELVRYGREKGVRILPGVSAFSYGGVFYDPTAVAQSGHDRRFGSHPYSLYTWLSKHPEYAAQNEQGQPYPFGPLNILACPSRPENIAWFREALAWLYEEFDIDGIQVEVGDYSICHCPLCRSRRRGVQQNKSYSIDDMAATYTAAVEVSLAAKPDAWVLCETYSSIAYPWKEETGGGWRSMDIADRRLLSVLPEKSILQWGVDRAIGGCSTEQWPDDIYSPMKDNVLRIHAGSQWSQNGPADWAVELVFDLLRQARTHNVNGVSVFGEESSFAPPNEANYLAFEEASGFGRPNPGLSVDQFYAQTLDPLYGGSGYAKRWRQLYIRGRMLLLGEKLNSTPNSRQPLELLTDDPDFRRKALSWTDAERIAAIEGYYAEARQLSAGLAGEVSGRWSWLENELWNMRYVITTRPSR